MYACQRVDSLFKSQRTYFYDLWSRYQYGPFLRLLISWYSGQSCSILWAGVISSVFFVTNGVRQGGVLSPLLFNLYIDELSLALNCINAGCCLGNHLLYADDVVLFAPSAKGLQALLDTCTCFAARHDIFFNTRKSQVLVVPGRNMPTAKPCFRLCNSAMDFTDQYKYLGHIIANDLRDDADISRQTRSLYARANMLLRKFSAAQTTTKVMLFNAFCSPIYGCQLWFNFVRAFSSLTCCLQ